MAPPTAETYQVLLTGNPGTEDVMALEAEEELYATRILDVRRGHGRVVASIPQWSLERVYSMRSIHSAILLHRVARGISPGPEGLDEIGRAALESGLHRFIPDGATFAVRAIRAGNHSFHSPDIARVVGDSIARSALAEGRSVRVRLSSPSIVIEAHLIEDTLYLGVSLSGSRSLHRRGVRVYDHPAALKPTLAYVMLRLAQARDGEVIADPMCGGGTVAIEAALTFVQSSIICMDKNAAHIEGAKMNAAAARVSRRVKFLVGDARSIHELLGRSSIDVVVSNPPYGIRLGSPSAVRGLYRDFVPSLAEALSPGGRAALITTEGALIQRLAGNAGLRVEHTRRVRHGDLWATIVVVRKPGG